MTAASGKLLELEGVTKRWEAVDSGPGPEVLRGVSLSVGSGESIAVVGPSGSGKSTLLNTSHAPPPSSGRVVLEGRDLSSLEADELAAVRNERLGFVFQSHHLLPQCTALENVLVPDAGREALGRRARAALAQRARDPARPRRPGGRAPRHRPGPALRRRVPARGRRGAP